MRGMGLDGLVLIRDTPSSTRCGGFHIVYPTEKTMLCELSEDFLLPQLPEFLPQ